MKLVSQTEIDAQMWIPADSILFGPALIPDPDSENWTSDRSAGTFCLVAPSGGRSSLNVYNTGIYYYCPRKYDCTRL